MAISDLLRHFLPSSTEREPDREAQAERARDAAEARRESERRWYAHLPIIAISTLCIAVAMLTGLLALASRYTLSPPLSQPAKEAPGPPPPPPSTASAPNAAASEPVVRKSSLQSKALFGFDSSKLRAVAGPVKKELDACLKPGLAAVHIVGYTDCIGSEEYNRDLSARRAAEIKRYLAERGIDVALITAEGLGWNLAKATEPLCKGNVQKTPSNIAKLERFRRVDVMCEYKSDRALRTEL